MVTNSTGSKPMPKLIEDFSDYADNQIDFWIEKYVVRGLTAELQCRLLFEERARRQSKVLSIEKSLKHLIQAARLKQFTTYVELAKASGVDWSKARNLMNGPKGHLDRLLEVCDARDMPLLTALCVNQDAATTGELADNALDGFVKGAQRLGYEVVNPREFLRQCQKRCFDWAASLLDQD
jgi:hypothetical protein